MMAHMFCLCCTERIQPQTQDISLRTSCTALQRDVIIARSCPDAAVLSGGFPARLLQSAPFARFPGVAALLCLGIGSTTLTFGGNCKPKITQATWRPAAEAKLGHSGVLRGSVIR